MSDRIMDMIRTNRRRVWSIHEKPEEVKRLLRKKTVFDQNCSILMYAESETRVLVDILWIIRNSAKEKYVDLGCLSKMAAGFLKFFARRFRNEYQEALEITVSTLEECESAIMQAKSVEIIQSIVEELLLYIGQLNFIIDQEIPWKDIADTYELVKTREQRP